MDMVLYRKKISDMYGQNNCQATAEVKRLFVDVPDEGWKQHAIHKQGRTGKDRSSNSSSGSMATEYEMLVRAHEENEKVCKHAEVRYNVRR